jgi:hypothetical protein
VSARSSSPRPRGGPVRSCSPRQNRAARCGSRKAEPAGSTPGRLTPARAGDPGRPRPARHPARSPRQAAAAPRAPRWPATSDGKQQAEPGRRSRAPGHWSMAHAPTARCTDHDERAQGRRGATGPDPRTAQSGSARSGGGSSRRKLPGIGSRPSAADVNHGRVTMYAVGPAGMQDSRIWAASVLNRKRAGSRAERTDTRAAMTAEPAAVRDQQTAEGAGRHSRECSAWGARLTHDRARQKADRPLCAVRADRPGLCQRHCRCVRPQIPGSSPCGLGPHRTSSGSPGGLASGFPFARRVLPRPPPSSGFPRSGVLRFGPFGHCPVPVLSLSVSLLGPFPLSDLHGSAAARRFRRRWSPAAGTKVTSNAAPLARSRDPPASRRAAAGHDRMRPHRIACY